MQMVGFSREWIIPHRVYLYVHHISFINSPFDGHLGCLQPHGLNSPWDFPYLSYHEQCWSEHGTIGTSLISCFHFFFSFFGHYLEVGLLYHVEILFLTFWGNGLVFQSALPIHIPISNATGVLFSALSSILVLLDDSLSNS